MEQKPEEIVTNETEESENLRIRDCNVSTDPIESMGCSSFESPVFYESTSSDYHGSSSLTHLDIVEHYSLNSNEMSLAYRTPFLRSPYLENYTGFTVEEEIAINYGYHNADVAGCSSTKNEIDDDEGWSRSIGCRWQDSRIAGEEFMCNNNGSFKLCPSKDVRRVLTSFQDVKVSSSNQKNMDSCISAHVAEHPSSIISDNGPTREISVHATEGPNNITSSSIPVGSRFSSSFFDFFFRGSQNASHGNPRASNESRTTSMVQHETCSTLTPHDENVHCLRGDASDVLMNKSSISCSLDNVREGLESSHCGINLREWLESNGVDANKNEKMLLFRQIVQRVDDAHSQGIAMLELRPSSFILLETGDVKYIGSLIETELCYVNQDNTKKRGLKPKNSSHENLRAKILKLGTDKLVRPESHFMSRIDIGKDKVNDHFNYSNLLPEVHDFSIYEGTYTRKSWLSSQNAQLEKKWYDFPEQYKMGDLKSLNIYSLGLMLFEFLSHFESLEAHSATMLDLHHRILPPIFLSTSPKEAGFCFWLLHPEPSSRPTTREILQSDLMSGLDVASLSNNESSRIDAVDDVESDLLLYFLITLNQDRRNKACNLLESMKFLDSDIKMVESMQTSARSSEVMDGNYNSNMKDKVHNPSSSSSRINVLKDKLLGNIIELENAYFSERSDQLIDVCDTTRSDMDVLRKRNHLSKVGTRHKSTIAEEKSIDRVQTFFDGICKFARYNKFEVCGTLRNSDMANSTNVICSLCFDREEEYIATAGVSKKIKIFEFQSLLNDYVDVQYPILEMLNNSKFSCICWNKYTKNYLASTDYEGVVQVWDANTGKGFGQYNEHQKRAWSVDFSQVDPRKFASGGDDCFLKIWSMDERNSTGTIRNPANICCVQFSSYSSHLLAFGSADYKIYTYDLRHTRIPWCTLAGHENAVSYVRFLDSETLVSASTDNTIKLWDLKKTKLDGLSPDACRLTFRGHTNVKNFVGLAVLDGYIVCGSETNEVFAYHKSLPMPITRHKFGCIDPMSGDEVSDNDGDDEFVSSVCWRRKSQMIAAANSSGSIKILQLV